MPTASFLSMAGHAFTAWPAAKEQLLNKFHNAFGEIREDDGSFLQTLFN
jgi:hypothetical protein